MVDDRIIAVSFGDALMPAVFALRHAVFVVEQAVPPELERDELDAIAVHVVALRGDEVIGTLRLVVNGGAAKIGRMAVRMTVRRQGVGSRLMARAVEIARSMHVADVTLHAQLSARRFYERLGYCAEGPVFEEAGIAHVAMHRRLP